MCAGDLEKPLENHGKQSEVNLLQLQPAKLLNIAICINGRIVKALIDSGATNCLIKEDLTVGNKTDALNCPKHILGLGPNKLNVKAKTQVEFSWVNMPFVFEGFVIDNKNFGYDVVLGMDFLLKNNISVDMKA